MTKQQVIGEINQMPLLDKIQIMEWIAKAIREEFEKQLKVEKQVKKLSLAESAKLLLADYENDKELTIFTTLDAENLYEEKFGMSILTQQLVQK
jgi:hypothetical protein